MSNKIGFILVPVLIVLSIIGVVAYVGSYGGSETTQVCTVNDKDRSTSTDADGNSKSVYRVYTDDCGVFSIEDTFFGGINLNSADRYNAIKVGQRYQFTTFGWRNPMFSMFPNIVGVQPV